MGLVAGGVYYGLYLLVPISVLCLVFAIVVGGLTYFVCYLKLGRPSAEELGALPGGGLMIRLGRKLGML